MIEQNLYNSPDVANRIKSYAKSKKISLKSILEDCKLGSNTFSHMLHGKSIAFDSLAKMADYLGCSVDYLLGRTNMPQIYSNNVIHTGDITGSHNFNLNINSKNNSKNATKDTSSDTSELVELIESLPLLKRAEAVIYLNSLKENE